jgi:hypothetical protein
MVNYAMTEYNLLNTKSKKCRIKRARLLKPFYCFLGI